LLHFHSNRPLIVGWLAGLVTAGIIAGVIGLLTFTGSAFGGGVTGSALPGLAYGRREWAGVSVA